MHIYIYIYIYIYTYIVGRGARRGAWGRPPRNGPPPLLWGLGPPAPPWGTAAVAVDLGPPAPQWATAAAVGPGAQGRPQRAPVNVLPDIAEY